MKPADTVLLSQAEVTMSRKPIKKMINIHEADAVSTCRWRALPVLSLSRAQAPTIKMEAMNRAVQPVAVAVSWEVKIRRLI